MHRLGCGVRAQSVTRVLALPRWVLVVISSRPGCPRARRGEITTPDALPLISERCRGRAGPKLGGVVRIAL
jgi:hypothetical protein